MLEFFLNNNPFVLNRDISIRIDWNNPAMFFDEFPGDKGMNINIPVNNNNRMLLGNPERFEKAASKNSREFQGFEARFGGVLLLSGTLIIQTANSETYNGWLRSNIGNLGAIHREKYIYDSLSFNREKTFENKSSYDPDLDDYACPDVYNPDFFKDKGEKTTATHYISNPNFGKLVSKWHWWPPGYYPSIDDRQTIPKRVETEDYTEAFLQNSGWVVNKKNPDGTVRTPNALSFAYSDDIIKNLDVAVVSPMLFLHYVLETIFKDAEYFTNKNCISHDMDMKRLVVYHNFDITEIGNDYEGDEFSYEYFYGGKDAVYDDYNPKPESLGFEIKWITRKVNTFFYKDLLPKIKLKDFVLSTMSLLNIFPFFHRQRKIIDIIDREAILTEQPVDIDLYMTGEWELGEENDKTIEFSFEIDSNDLVFNEHWTDISDYRDKEKEPVEFFEDLLEIEKPEIDEIRFVKDSNGYAQYKQWIKESNDEETSENDSTKFIGWKLLTIAFQKAFLNYGKEETDTIKTAFSTLNAMNGETANTKQKGNIRSDLFDFENFSPRLIFYKSDNTGCYKTDTLSLDWEDAETGLLEKRWKNWARFLSTKQPVSREANLPLNTLVYILNNIYKKFRTREGEFIIESVSTEFGIDRISTSTIKGFKINYAPRTYNLTDMWKIEDFIWIDEYVNGNGAERFYPLIAI